MTDDPSAFLIHLLLLHCISYHSLIPFFPSTSPFSLSHPSLTITLYILPLFNPLLSLHLSLQPFSSISYPYTVSYHTLIPFFPSTSPFSFSHPFLTLTLYLTTLLIPFFPSTSFFLFWFYLHIPLLPLS